MADEGSADTFTYTLAGREILFFKATQAQLLMMQRIVQRIQRQMHAAQDHPETVSDLIVQLHNFAFEAVESRFADPADLTFVEQEVLRGNISQEQIFGILSNGNAHNNTPDDDADPAPAKRGRKAPAKKAAPAKKTANPRRAAR